MEIKVTDEQFKDMVSKAMFEQMPATQRDELVATAIRQLMTPSKNSYAYGTLSPLQEAFNNAVRSVAIAHVEQRLKTDQSFIDQVDGLITDAVKKMAGEDREKTVQSIARAIADGLSKRD